MALRDGETSSKARQMQLERQVQQVTQERDALQRDVEALCLSQGGAKLQGHSSVLAERLASANRELKQVLAQSSLHAEERDAALLKASAFKDQVTEVEGLLQAERERSNQIASEKEFHQASAARSLAELGVRHQELEAQRSRMVATELALSKAEAAADAERMARRELEASLVQRTQQLALCRHDLESRTTEYGAANRQLQQKQEQIRRMDGAATSLQAKVNMCTEDLERTRGQLQQVRESEGRLRLQLQDAHSLTAQAQGTTQGQAEQLASLTLQLGEVSSELAALRSSSTQELGEARAANKTFTAELATAKEQAQELAQELRGTQRDLAQHQALLADHRRAHHASTAAMFQAAGIGGSKPSTAGSLSTSGGGGVPSHASYQAKPVTPGLPASIALGAVPSTATATGSISARRKSFDRRQTPSPQVVPRSSWMGTASWMLGGTGTMTGTNGGEVDPNSAESSPSAPSSPVQERLRDSHPAQQADPSLSTKTVDSISINLAPVPLAPAPALAPEHKSSAGFDTTAVSGARAVHEAPPVVDLEQSSHVASKGSLASGPLPGDDTTPQGAKPVPQSGAAIIDASLTSKKGRKAAKAQKAAAALGQQAAQPQAPQQTKEDQQAQEDQQARAAQQAQEGLHSLEVQQTLEVQQAQEDQQKQDDQLALEVQHAAAAAYAAEWAAQDAEHEAEQLVVLRRLVHELKIKLADAVNEKVGALLSAAEYKQALASALQEVRDAKVTNSSQPAHPPTHPPSNGISTPTAAHPVGLASLMKLPGTWSASALHWATSSAAPAAPAPAPPAAAGSLVSRLAAHGGNSGGVVPPSSTGGTEAAGGAGDSGIARKQIQGMTCESGAAKRVSGEQGAEQQPVRQAVGQQVHPAVPEAHPAGDGAAPTPSLVRGVVSPVSQQGTPKVPEPLSLALTQLAAESEGYATGLREAAWVILGTADAPRKWAALNELSKLHKQLNRTWSRLGWPKPASVLAGPPPPPGLSGVPMTMTSAGDAQEEEEASAERATQVVTAQVLSLVDLGLCALEAYNRHEAMCSVMGTGND